MKLQNGIGECETLHISGTTKKQLKNAIRCFYSCIGTNNFECFYIDETTETPKLILSNYKPAPYFYYLEKRLETPDECYIFAKKWINNTLKRFIMEEDMIPGFSVKYIHDILPYLSLIHI